MLLFSKCVTRSCFLQLIFHNDIFPIVSQCRRRVGGGVGKQKKVSLMRFFGCL